MAGVENMAYVDELIIDISEHKFEVKAVYLEGETIEIGEEDKFRTFVSHDVIQEAIVNTSDVFYV